MRCLPALTAGFPRLLRCPPMGGAFDVRRLASHGRDDSALLVRHICKSALLRAHLCVRQQIEVVDRRNERGRLDWIVLLAATTEAAPGYGSENISAF